MTGRCPFCGEVDPADLMDGGQYCFACDKSWGSPKPKLKKPPFYDSQLDVLPIDEFIAKYPDHKLMERERWVIFSQIGYDCVFCGLSGTHVCWYYQRENRNSQHWDLAGYDEAGKLTMLTRDHKIPKSKGGPNSVSNYQTACSPCNEKKGNKIV